MYIQGYQSKPSFELIGKSMWGVFFGVELEVEVDTERGIRDKDAKAGQVTKTIGKFTITKHDGSLRYGFEICSSPASFDFHQTAWDNFFSEEILEDLKGYGTNTAGMHVHVSRKPLSDLQIGKIISFIHNPENAKFVRRIAQRDSNRYNDYSKVKKATAVHDKNLANEARYTAVNLLNKNTIEFRIFKSNLKRESFLRNIEFCAALTYFAWPSARSIQQAQSWKEFARFVSRDRKVYPHLYSYLVRNKYIISRRLSKYANTNAEKKYGMTIDQIFQQKKDKKEQAKILKLQRIEEEKKKRLRKTKLREPRYYYDNHTT